MLPLGTADRGTDLASRRGAGTECTDFFMLNQESALRDDSEEMRVCERRTRE